MSDTTLTTDVNTEPADTRGWDTVYAIRREFINQAIVTKAVTPGNFQHQAGGMLPTTVQGSWLPWEITAGGSGPELHMRAAINKGAATVGSFNADLTGSFCILIVHLSYFKEDDTKETFLTPKPGPVDLKVDDTTPVSVMSFTPGANMEAQMIGHENDRLTIVAQIQSALSSWFNVHFVEFAHVFASVDINDVADTGDFAWLKPTATGYAQDAGGKGIFGVLAMTGKDGPAKLPSLDLEVTASAIPDGAKSAFLISSRNFLQHFIRKGLSEGDGAWGKDSDFEIDPGGTELHNIHPLSIDFVADGKSYTGVIEDSHGLSITVKGTQLVIDMPKVKVTVSPGIYLILEYDEWLNVTLKDQVGADGKTGRVFWLEQVPNTPPVIDSHTEMSGGVKGGLIAAEIVSSIVLAVFGVGVARSGIGAGMTALGRRLLKALVVAVAAAIVEVIVLTPTWIELAAENNYSGLPNFESFVDKAISSIRWPNSNGYELVSASLNGSLCLVIEPKFITDAPKPPAPPARPTGLRVARA